MKTKVFVLAMMVLCSLTARTGFAKDKDAYLGAWGLKQTKASITGVHVVMGADGNTQLALDAADVPVEVRVVYAAADGGNIKMTSDGAYQNGQTLASHIEWTGKFDGNDYPVTGDPTEDTRAYKMIDDHTLELTIKKDGKVATAGPVTISFRGKTCTVKTPKMTAVYGRQ